MKKHIKPIVVSIICVFVCITMLGCGVNYDFGNTLNEDESFTIDILYAESDDDGNWYAPTKYDFKAIYEEQGYEVSTYEQDENNNYLELKYTVDSIDDLCIKSPSGEKFDVGDFLSGNLQDILDKGIYNCETTDHSRIYNADFVYDAKYIDPYSKKYEWTSYKDSLAIETEKEANGEQNHKVALVSAAQGSSVMYMIKLEKGNMVYENSAEFTKEESEEESGSEGENSEQQALPENTYIWNLKTNSTGEIKYSIEILNDVSVDYKEKELELITENIEQGTEVHFKVKKLDKLKEIVILDEKNNRIEYKKVEGTEDEYYFIMPTSSVKISIEYKVLNPKTLSGLSIGLNLIIIFAISGLIIINKHNKLIGGSNE